MCIWCWNTPTWAMFRFLSVGSPTLSFSLKKMQHLRFKFEVYVIALIVNILERKDEMSFFPAASDVEKTTAWAIVLFLNVLWRAMTPNHMLFDIQWNFCQLFFVIWLAKTYKYCRCALPVFRVIDTFGYDPNEPVSISWNR